MNRRRFLELTVALAAMSGTAGYVVGTAPPVVSGPAWIPTEDEVEEWLEYYKIATAEKHRTLAEILTTAFDVEDTAEGLKMLEHRAAKVGDPAVDEVRSFEEAEAAFTRAEADRTRVGQALCNGYNAGVIGDARQNFHFTHPSHEGFAWFNGWALGDWDRRWKARLVKGTYEQHRAMLKAAKQPVVST